MTPSAPPRVRKLPAVKQRRMDELLEKNSQGTLTPAERTRLEALVAEAEQVMVENSRRLADFVNATDSAPADVVPVTVWIKPAPADVRR